MADSAEIVIHHDQNVTSEAVRTSLEVGRREKS